MAVSGQRLAEGFGFEKLDVYRAGMELVRTVYRLSSDFPDPERYGLTSQMRRAAVSIPTNLAEGYGRTTPLAFASFVRVSLGSAYELRTLLTIAADLGYVDPQASANLAEECVRVCKMLDGLHRSLEAKAVHEHTSDYELLTADR